MKLTVSVESAELKLRQILEDFFVSVYDEKNLFSHGINHHRRVWNYAKELLSIPLSQNNLKPTCSPDKLIIACYLHDIGMYADPGPRHGKHSRELCIQFLGKYNLSEEDYKDVLDTIMNHDRKDYSSETGRNDLLTVLSVADDLDAFGFAGIYRYSEIYLTRGANPEQIGNLILENAEGRFGNFIKIFNSPGDYIQIHSKRYKILTNFFTHYNKQVGSYNFMTDDPEGYCGVIQLFMMMVRNKMTPDELFQVAEKYQDDILIGPFLHGLRTELKTTI
jgi:hypothetical protein